MAARRTSFERTAAAAIVAMLAGLVLPYVTKQGLEISAPVWFSFTLLIGLLLGGSARVPIKSAVTSALLPSALLPATFAGVWLVRFLRDWAAAPMNVPPFGPRPSGIPLDTSRPLVQALLLVFLVLLFLGTLVVVSLASLGQRPLVMWLTRVYKLGPEGFERIQRIVIAAAGAIAAIASLWSIWILGRGA